MTTHPCEILLMWLNGVDFEHKKESLDYWPLRISLTNVRYPTFDVNENQGTRYILLSMNGFVEVKWTAEFIHQETLMYFLSRWRGYLPLRHAGSYVHYLTLTWFQIMWWCRWDKPCWKVGLKESHINQLEYKHNCLKDTRFEELIQIYKIDWEPCPLVTSFSSKVFVQLCQTSFFSQKEIFFPLLFHLFIYNNNFPTTLKRRHLSSCER